MYCLTKSFQGIENYEIFLNRLFISSNEIIYAIMEIYIAEKLFHNFFQYHAALVPFIFFQWFNLQIITGLKNLRYSVWIYVVKQDKKNKELKKIVINNNHAFFLLYFCLSFFVFMLILVAHLIVKSHSNYVL